MLTGPGDLAEELGSARTSTVDLVSKFRATPKSTVLHSARRGVVIGMTAAAATKNARLIVAFELATKTMLAVELRDASGAAVASKSRSGPGPQRVSFEVHAPATETPLSVWLVAPDAAAAAVEVTDIRFVVEDLDEPLALDHWAFGRGVRVGGDIVVPQGVSVLLTSPPLSVDGATRYLVDGEALVEGSARVQVWLENGAGERLGERFFDAGGNWLFACPCQSDRTGLVQINISIIADALCILRAPHVGFRPLTRWSSGFEEVETSLPHWNWWKRAIHEKCKRSMSFNGFVAAIETRLGREELLSLPQYMAICPTGQCNALCDFCSVTINRTGIIKRQLKHDVLSSFLAPVRKTVRVFGLEGNGEPTLYREFLPLVSEVTSGGTDGYLITNASRLDRETLKHLVLLESVNISLNAATAETHRRVMKLKEFEPAIASIKRLADMRGKRSDGWNASPRLSVSFVVTNDNVHEVQEFLAFAEYELGVDVVYIRPLSELGNDLGVVEDLRAIVPFDPDIDDMIEAIDEYISDRRQRLDIRYDPSTFRSTRPPPVGGVVLPRGYEDRLLAPRRSGWIRAAEARVSWTLSRVRLSLGRGACTDEFMSSQPIPVAPYRTLNFTASVHVMSGALSITIVDAAGGDILCSAEFSETAEPQSLSVSIEPGGCRALIIRMNSPTGVVADVDFGRTRKPAPLVEDLFVFPGPSRWERGVADVGFAWERRSVAFDSAAAPGLYLLRSFTTPCAQGRAVSLPIGGKILRGGIGVGVLAEGGARFLATAELREDETETVLRFLTEDSSSVSIAIYGLVPGGTAGSLAFGAAETTVDADWRPSMAPDTLRPTAQPARAATGDPDEEEDVPAGNDREPASPVAETPAKAPIRRSIVPVRKARRNWKRVMRDLVMGRNRLYCHKPWTDMHNFTVDGRVDVCCIATGPSQEYYQLGNLTRQSFQEVWNGERVREFRRTVNSDRPLPPCERCPMSHAYQGTWFDPVHTMGQYRSLFFSGEFLNRRYTRFIGYAGYALGWVVLQFVVFRGFRRHPLGGLGRVGSYLSRKLGI